MRLAPFLSPKFYYSSLPKFTPKTVASIDAAFESKFSESASPSPASTAPRSFIQPGRTYREELYSSRRIELTPTQATSSAFRELSQRLQEERIVQMVKERRYFVRPGLQKHAIIYAGRRKKFNQLVRDTINQIVQYKESQK